MSTLTIEPRSRWGARYANGVGNRPVGRLEKYGHHTVTSHLSVNATVAQERAEMRKIESIGQQRFGRGISYNFIIFPSGRIYEGASVHRIAYHSGSGRNTRGAGICFAGNYDTNRVGDRALAAAVALLQYGVKAGWWGDPALTEMHRDFSATACPGRHLYAQFDNINRMGRGQDKAPTPAPAPKPKPKPSGKTWPDVALPSRGSHNTATHNAWVKLLHDVGHLRSGEKLTNGFQRWLRSLGYNVGPVDGVFGPRTVRALQTFLVDKGLLPNRAYIDGDRGPVTVRAEIAYLNSQRRYY